MHIGHHCVHCMTAHFRSLDRARNTLFWTSAGVGRLHVDRLKPAHVLVDNQVAPAQVPRRSRPPSTGLMDSGFPSSSTSQLPELRFSLVFPGCPRRSHPQARTPSTSSLHPRFTPSGCLLKPTPKQQGNTLSRIKTNPHSLYSPTLFPRHTNNTLCNSHPPKTFFFSLEKKKGQSKLLGLGNMRNI